MPVAKVTANIGLPFGLGSIGGEWVPEDSERRAAWELYVELITRVSVVELPRGAGLLRETLNSYYSLFATVRTILKSYGPLIARPAEGSSVSFGHLAVAVLNWVLRPTLLKWHPLLDDYESRRPNGVSRLEWETAWGSNDQLRADIAIRGTLQSYAGLLGEVCDSKGVLRFATLPPGVGPDAPSR